MTDDREIIDTITLYISLSEYLRKVEKKLTKLLEDRLTESEEK